VARLQTGLAADSLMHPQSRYQYATRKRQLHFLQSPSIQTTRSSRLR